MTLSKQLVLPVLVMVARLRRLRQRPGEEAGDEISEAEGDVPRAEKRRDGEQPRPHEVRIQRDDDFAGPRRRRERTASRHDALSRRDRVSCLAAGKNIVKGTPSWVHFGDGKDVFDSQLTPGKHKLALQLGDDLHNTLPGACQVITVNVK